MQRADNLEEQAAYLQSLKEQAGLDLSDPKQRLLSELADTVSLLCHRVNLLGEVYEGLNETLAAVEEQVDFLCDLETEEEYEDHDDEYFDGSETPLYQVKCPQCEDQFAVDENSLLKGFNCPTCGEHLVQAE